MKRTTRWLAAVIVAALWQSLPCAAWADEGSRNAPLAGTGALAALAPADGASPSPARTPEANPWSFGVRAGYSNVPDFLLGAFMNRYMSVNGWFLEGVAARKLKGFTLHLGLSGTLMGADRGIWQRGPTKTPNDVTLDLGLLAADALFDWEVRLHRRFALHFGAGLGLGVLFGTINSIECTSVTAIGINQCSIPGTNPTVRDRKAESSWPIYPILHLQAGAHIDLWEKLALRIDFDFRNAFAVAAGLFYRL